MARALIMNFVTAKSMHQAGFLCAKKFYRNNTDLLKSAHTVHQTVVGDVDTHSGPYIDMFSFLDFANWDIKS